MRLAILLGSLLLLAGCERRYGKSVGYDDARTVFDPSHSRIAIGFAFRHYPPSRWSPAIEYGYEIQVFDLAHRVTPRRIARWKIGEREHPWLAGWDSLGIIVSRDPPGKFEVYRFDPVNGGARRLPGISSAQLQSWSVRLNEHGLSAFENRQRVHIEAELDGYYLWNPITRKKEFLFDLPAVHEGHPDPFRPSEEELAKLRFGDSLHRIWTASTRPRERDTIIDIQTYVPRPRPGSRDYRLELTVDLPDSSANARENGYRAARIEERRVRLGPEDEKLQVSIAHRTLRTLILPHEREMRRPEWSKTVGVSVGIVLRPVYQADDPGGVVPGSVGGPTGEADVGIHVPVARL